MYEIKCGKQSAREGVCKGQPIEEIVDDRLLQSHWRGRAPLFLVPMGGAPHKGQLEAWRFDGATLGFLGITCISWMTRFCGC